MCAGSFDIADIEAYTMPGWLAPIFSTLIKKYRTFDRITGLEGCWNPYVVI